MFAIRPFRLAPPVKFAGSSGYVGIDVGTHSIKLAQVARHGRSANNPPAGSQHGPSWRLVCARAFPHDQPLAFDDPPRCAAQIAASLDRVWDSSRRWLADDAACLLPLSAMTLRNVCLPAASAGEQRAMIGAELADDAGINADDWSLAWWPDDTGAGDAGTESLSVLGVSQELAECILEALLTRGLACTLMAGLPFVLATAAPCDLGSRSHAPIGILDWGYHSALFTVVAHGRPAFTRLLPGCGFRHLVEGVAERLNLDPRDVPRLICDTKRFLHVPPDEPTGPAQPDRSIHSVLGGGNQQQGKRSERWICSWDSALSKNVSRTNPPWGPGRLSELVGAGVAQLGEELLRTASFLQNQRSWLVPRQYVICGGGGTLRGGVQGLGEILQAPTSLWNGPFDSVEMTDLIPPPCLMAPAISLSMMRWESS